MTSVAAFSSAVTALFDELETLALAEMTGRDAALLGALDPLLEGAATPLGALRDEVTAAVDGVEAGDDLAAALVDALTNAGIEVNSRTVDGLVAFVKRGVRVSNALSLKDDSEKVAA